MRRSSISAAIFRSEARRHFDPVLEGAFAIASDDDYRIRYSRRELAVEVLYDAWEVRLVTLLEARIGERNVRAGLTCIYVVAGLGVAQQVLERARSPRLLSSALASQAEATGVVVSTLNQEDLSSAMLRCHGR